MTHEEKKMGDLVLVSYMTDLPGHAYGGKETEYYVLQTKKQKTKKRRVLEKRIRDPNADGEYWAAEENRDLRWEL